jgi:hypothetical protein
VQVGLRQMTFVIMFCWRFERRNRLHASDPSYAIASVGVEARYSLEGASPDRLHLQVHDASGDDELYIIGTRLYQRKGESWEIGPLFRPINDLPSVATLLRERLSDLTEESQAVQDGLPVRVFRGHVVWSGAVGQNDGTIEIRIDPGAQLPRTVSFSGRCGRMNCSFEQSLLYDDAIVIEPPIQ